MVIISSVQFSSVQSLSRVRLFATPWIAAHQASLSITNSQSSLRLMSIESVMPSSHLISSSVVPFSCPQSLPASGSFPVSQLFAWGGQSIGVSASAVLFLLWLHPFILSGVISPLISSSILGTYRPREFPFQYPIILPFHTVHGVLKARILKWFAISFSSGPHSVRPLYHDPPVLGGPTQHGLVSLS